MTTSITAVHQWSMLPQEILHNIFQYLFLPSIHFNLSLVCWRWYRLINCEQFATVYTMNVGKTSLVKDVTGATNNVMKCMFDWSELIIHRYPSLYEGIQRLRNGILHVALMPDDCVEKCLSCCVELTLKGADDRPVTMYLNKIDGNLLVIHAYVNKEHQIVASTSSEAILLLTGSIYCGFSCREPLNNHVASELHIFNRELELYLNDIPPALFWGMIEAFCFNYRSFERRLFYRTFLQHCSSLIGYRYNIANNDKQSPEIVLLGQRMISYLGNREPLFHKAVTQGRVSICYRFMNCGQKLPDAFVKKSVIINSYREINTDMLRFLIIYGEKNNVGVKEVLKLRAPQIAKRAKAADLQFLEDNQIDIFPFQ